MKHFGNILKIIVTENKDIISTGDLNMVLLRFDQNK